MNFTPGMQVKAIYKVIYGDVKEEMMSVEKEIKYAEKVKRLTNQAINLVLLNCDEKIIDFWLDCKLEAEKL